MLKKVNRLKSKEIPKIAYKGKKVGNQNFMIRILFDTKLEQSKFAVSVSTKISKKAVIRNKIKRKIKTALLSINDSIKTANYLVVVKNVQIVEKNPEELALELKKIINE